MPAPLTTQWAPLPLHGPMPSTTRGPGSSTAPLGIDAFPREEGHANKDVKWAPSGSLTEGTCTCLNSYGGLEYSTTKRVTYVGMSIHHEGNSCSARRSCRCSQ